MNALTVVRSGNAWQVLTAAGRVVAVTYTETDADQVREALGRVRMGVAPAGEVVTDCLCCEDCGTAAVAYCPKCDPQSAPAAQGCSCPSGHAATFTLTDTACPQHGKEAATAQQPVVDDDDLEFFQVPPGLNPATVNLVARFATALAAKLSAAEQKYGYSDGWANDDWMDECRQKLVEHVAKGDPRDVAAYCAFLWHHGERTELPQPVAVDGVSIEQRARELLAEAEKGPVNDYGTVHRRTAHFAIAAALRSGSKA